MLSSRCCFLLVPFVAVGVLTAQTTPLQDDAPPDAKILNDQVKAFAEARAQRKSEFFERARQEVIKPLQTPGAAGNYLIECMRIVQYEGKNGGNAEFAEWKKKNRDMFSDRNLERASELYLQYLALTLRRAPLKSAESLQSDLWTYLNALYEAKDLIANVVKEQTKITMSIYDPKEDKVTGEMTVSNVQDMKLASAANARNFVQDLLNQGVNGGLVAQALKLPGHLNQISNWEMVPGNFSGIMDQDVRTVLREKKDPKLLSTWDYEITFLGAIAELKKDKGELEKFQRETYPRLIWKKAADAELLGLSNRALNMRLDIAKKYPEHPDFEEWAKQIEQQLATLKTAEESAKKEAAPAKDAAVVPVQPVPAAETVPAPSAPTP